MMFFDRIFWGSGILATTPPLLSTDLQQGGLVARNTSDAIKQHVATTQHQFIEPSQYLLECSSLQDRSALLLLLMEMVAHQNQEAPSKQAH